MGENQNYLLRGAMTYGVSLGLYWIFKYIFWMLSLKFSFLSIVYLLLTLAVPFLAYDLTKRYKNDIGGQISFFHAWRFGMMLYLFAALIISLVHFSFYQFFAPQDFVHHSARQLAEWLQNAEIEQQLVESISQMNVSPIHMAIQGIFNNIFYGIILSIPVAAVVCRQKKGTSAGNADVAEKQQ